MMSTKTIFFLHSTVHFGRINKFSGNFHAI